MYILVPYTEPQGPTYYRLEPGYLYQVPGELRDELRAALDERYGRTWYTPPKPEPPSPMQRFFDPGSVFAPYIPLQSFEFPYGE